jgi:hypothetical protein
MDCQYCNKTFASKASMLRHQKNLTYCINIQEKLKDPKAQLTCNGCQKSLSNKYTLATHKKTCKLLKIEIDDDKKTENEVLLLKEKLEQDKIIIEKLETRIRELELDIKDIALKSRGGKITNNGNTYVYQNFTPITDEKLKQDTLNFTKKHLERGGQGIAQYALKGVLKDNFTCTDVSRGHSKYMDADGDIVVDPFSHSIARRVCESLIEPSEKINDDNRSTLSYDTSESVLTKAGILNKTVNDIKNASTGIMNDLTRDFTKTICADSVRKCI